MAQKKSWISLDLAPSLMGTYSLKYEKQLSHISSVEVGGGFRYQSIDTGQTASIRSLQRFRGLSNKAQFITLGIRFFEDNLYEHPYLSAHFAAVHYKETVLTEAIVFEEVSGFNIGISMSLGVDFKLSDRLRIDLAFQGSYSPPREIPLNYYLPGIGYNTFSLNLIAVPGLHIQPVLAIRYQLKKDKRKIILEKE